MHTIQLSPELHNAVNLFKTSAGSSSMKEKMISAFAVSNEESKALMKTFNLPSNSKAKLPKEPVSIWG
ncbi:hypothetical protein [Paenibacillus eucommiae]|uniref:Uncharacterized protein n=1 Tax=Paenibacillus eucommiae TaxID=1355755 RepID=A0ABS4IZA7_9BACL|nr:hypothetical protein [Paenibacillus eucommiae]MBP1992915.1 hypothetical protein [Paenibacillus eucommiae]